MKAHLTRNSMLLLIGLIAVTSSCSRKFNTSSLFEQQTASHKVIAVLPAQMVFTGTQPKNLTSENIKQIEEQESKDFQIALYNSILRYAHSRRYYTTVNVQDFALTQKLLADNNISIRDSWFKKDAELAALLGVDAVVKMRIQKKRYMSDAASYTIDVVRQIGNEIGVGGRVPLPGGIGKTNDIYATCSLVSNGQALWNENYKGASNWNYKPNEIIEGITDNFGQNFPYKRKR
jgi:hypothetical protein